MSKQQVPTASPPRTSHCSPIATLITNLRLLDLDKHDDWPGLSAQVFTAKDTPPNQKNRIKCVEWVFYHLYQIWSPEECQNKLQPFFPPLEPLQSINLRASLFRCLNELKKNAILGRDVSIRKSMFDECKGEMVYELLSAFSTIVVLRLLPSDMTGKTSIVGRLCLAEKVFPKEYPSLLPLAIAHRMSLKTLLEKKRILKARYRDFGNALDNKDQDLSKKFDKVVETQEYLDKNASFESTVERVGRVLDQHWQGDHRLVGVIAQGEEHGLRDMLLDQEFETVWPIISSGKFDGDISTSQHGLLENLEKRVAAQKFRLQQWRCFKNDLEEKNRVGGGTTTDLPARQPFGSPKSRRYEQRKEKDLIFSPRKSPRKSMWPVSSPIDAATSEGGKESYIKPDAGSPRSTPKADTLADAPSPLPAAKSRKPFELASKGLLANISFGEDSVDSSFSEVLRAEYEICKAKDGKEDSYDHMPQISIPNTESNKIDERGTLSNPRKETHNVMPMPLLGKLDEDKLLAEQLVASTISAPPTPLRHRLSLAERTRQSMTFASASTKMPNEEMLLPIPRTIQEEATPSICVDRRATLAERTRQSISRVPAKPTRRLSRRISKIYPTNQFQTPTRQTTAQRSTLPEELMSPGAGYDNVFKSRPKIALSPTASPVPDDEDERDLEISDDQIDCRLQDSPLARLTARA